MKHVLYLTGCILFFSCGGGEKQENKNTGNDNAVKSDTDTIVEEKKQFYCLVNGKEFTFDEHHCTRNPDFNKYNFSFFGDASVNISLNFSCEKKTVPFTIEIPVGKETESEARILYDKPPTPHGETVNTNIITVTEWDTLNHIISLEFKGKLTDIDKTQVIEIDGYLNEMPYDYFK